MCVIPLDFYRTWFKENSGSGSLDNFNYLVTKTNNYYKKT